MHKFQQVILGSTITLMHVQMFEFNKFAFS